MDPKPWNRRECVRKRPGMYFGEVNSRGVVHVINELVSNGIDLYLQGSASRVGIQVSDKSITYSDDGPGLPYDVAGPNGVSLAEHYLTDYHDTPTADQHAPHIHLLSRGLGLMCVNAASAWLEVSTWRAGCLWVQRFRQGLPAERAQIMERGTGTGTVIRFRLDSEVFCELLPAPDLLRKLMFEAAHLFPGVALTLNQETFLAPRGLADLASLYHVSSTTSLFSTPQAFHFNDRSNDVQIHVGLIGETQSATLCRSWVNGSVTCRHGTHVQGLCDALRASNYRPAIAMIHVVMHSG